jgi:molecular chaperone DnaK (HSP70)
MGFIGVEVSLLRVIKGHLREIAHEGSDSPSGRDFNLSVMANCVDQFKRQGSPLPTKTYRNHWFDFQAIVAEAKHQLTIKEETLLSLPTYITGTEPQDVLLTREDFEQLIAPNIHLSMEWVDGVLEDANLQCDNIDKVLLVGGSTRINYIQNLLEDRFGFNLIQPRDERLARGAAVQANKLAGEDQNNAHLATKSGVEVYAAVKVEGEQRDQKFVERFPVDDKVKQPEIEPLFEYAQRLVEVGAYEEADEFLNEILNRLQSVRRGLKKLNQ